ncbi:protein containing DUF721 [Candidatus Omnitrophus magneticus]|uniref:Protein containing DUF721 n=1 Tax=Candidatus Omnitrophus magneticus TaxID=1609969 RepID=A0A0F0CR85_9BACT|nr:protein containing DUF721 [Candidatus Omnitrophus magneticus]
MFKQHIKKTAEVRVSDVLSGIVKKLEKENFIKGVKIKDAWEKAVGIDVLGHAEPVSFKKGVLLVLVENSVWLYKLTMGKREIIEKFNNVFEGKKAVVDIRYRMGSIYRSF